MRQIFLLLAALSIAGTAHAATPQGVVFGSAKCGPEFSCMVAQTGDLTAMVAAANACMSSKLSMTMEGGLFEAGAGLDGNRCLTTKSLPKAAAGLTMVPQCCAVQVSDDKCVVECARYGTN